MAIQPFTYDSIKTGGWLNGTSLAAPARPRPRVGGRAVGPGLGPDRQARLQPERLRRLELGRQQPLASVRDRRAQVPGLQPGARRRTRRDHRRHRGTGRARTPARSGRRSPAAASGSAPSRGRPAATTTARPSTRIRTAWRASSAALRPGPTLNTVDRGAAVKMEFDAGGDRGLDILASNSPYSRQVDCTTLRTETRGRSSSRRGRCRSRRRHRATPGSPTTRQRAATRSRGRRSRSGAARAASSSSRGTTASSTAPTSASRRTPRTQSRDASATPTASPSRTPPSRCVGRSSRRRRATPTAGTRSSRAEGHVRRQRPRQAGATSPQTQTVDLSRPRTVDFTLPRRSDAFGYTCGLETASFEQADTVVPITGDDVAGTIDLPFAFTFYGFPLHAGSRLHERLHRARRPGDHQLLGGERRDPDHRSAQRCDLLVLGRHVRRRAGVDPHRDKGSVAEPALRDRVQEPPLLRGHEPARRLQHRSPRERGDRHAVPQPGRRRPRAGQLGDDRHREPHGQDALRFAFNESVLAPEPAVTSIRYRPPPLPPSHTVSGQVRDSENQPIANATVTIEDTPITPATTDANGFYSFERVPEGTLQHGRGSPGARPRRRRSSSCPARRRSTSRSRPRPTASGTPAAWRATCPSRRPTRSCRSPGTTRRP